MAGEGHVLLRYTYVNHPSDGVDICLRSPIDFSIEDVRIAANGEAENGYWKEPPAAPAQRS